jgi:hypothetical protein
MGPEGPRGHSGEKRESPYGVGRPEKSENPSIKVPDRELVARIMARWGATQKLTRRLAGRYETRRHSRETPWQKRPEAGRLNPPASGDRVTSAGAVAPDAMQHRPADVRPRHTGDAVATGPQSPEMAEPSLAGDTPDARVTRLHPVTLDVVSPYHGHVRVAGLARFFPAHTVHAQRSTAVVAGDNCKLQSVDHYHVHRVSVSLDQLLKQGSRGHAALQDLLRDPTGGVARFQQVMRSIADPPEHRDTQASVPVRLHHLMSVTSSTGVQQGDRARMHVRTHYMVEESELPIVDLLARDPGLVRSLAAAVDGPERGPETSKFLRDALRSAGRTDDLALLDHSTGLHAPTTSIFGLFGLDIVDRATVVMAGAGNQVRTGIQVDRSIPRPGTLLADLGQIRKQRAPGPRAEGRTPTGRPGRATPAAEPRTHPVPDRIRPTVPGRSRIAKDRGGRLGGSPGRGRG